MQAPAVQRNNSNPVFVFAYGSLIWRPGFEHTGVRQAVVSGYERRFWQASHDHRGTIACPGRVVTMVPVDGGQCEGLIYRVPEQSVEQILATLDEREQDGYERTWLQAIVRDQREPVTVLTWLASAGNPSWAGEQPVDQLAQLIHTRHGPSGSNREYLIRLHEAFEKMGIHDEHVSTLASRVKALSGR